jgi:NO-binding membrane sensor protein with MHYT domain
MLGVHLPVPVLYDWPTVVLSLLASILGSGAALLTLRSGKIDWPRTLLASLFMGGAGISGLHYVAMAAMRLQGAQHYSPVLVTLSVASAVAICWMALTRNSIFRADTVGHRWRTHASAVLRGSANPVMHYIAMAALTFTPSDQIPNLSHAVSIQSLGVIGISVVPVMLLVVVLLTSLADRLQKERALLDELFEQAPQAVALLSADNLIVRVNSEFTRLFGYSE